jgi:peptidoglycan/LPS O-acetylase OafA/YrhL
MRIDKIDLLRFIGLSCIILAHVDPPGMIFQIRNFDVPLMVLISGIVFDYSKKREIKYKDYVLSRVFRLCLPVWLLLTFLFAAVYCICLFFNLEYPFQLNAIVKSYLLLSGIGYVWIIRVFILVALVAPFIRLMNEKVRSNIIYFLIILFALLAYSDLLPWLVPYPIIRETLLYLIPYSCVFALGMRLRRVSRNEILLIASLSLMTFLSLLFIHSIQLGELVKTQAYKYPSRIYYLSYAIFASLFLYMASDALFNLISKLKLRSPVTFIGRNSMWIYLWHIVFIQLKDLFELSFDNFLLFYIFIYTSAVATTYVQIASVNKFIARHNIDGSNKKRILSILTG